MSNGKTPKKPIEKENEGENPKDSKQVTNDLNQKEPRSTKAKLECSLGKKVNDSIDNNCGQKESCDAKDKVYVQETCQSKGKIEEQERVEQKQIVSRKETCTKLLPYNLQTQKTVLFEKETCTKLLPYNVQNEAAFSNSQSKGKESCSKDLITPQEKGIVDAQKTGAIKKTTKPLPIFQVVPQKKDNIIYKTVKTDLIKGQDLQIKDTMIREKAATIQAISPQTEPSDLQKYLLGKMGKLSGAAIQVDCDLPKRVIQTDEDLAKIKAMSIVDDAKLLLDDRAKYVPTKEETKVTVTDLKRDEYPFKADTKQLEVCSDGRQYDCQKDRIKPTQKRDREEDESQKLKTDLKEDQYMLDVADHKGKQDLAHLSKDQYPLDVTDPKEEQMQYDFDLAAKDMPNAYKVDEITEAKVEFLEIDLADLKEDYFEGLLSSFDSVDEFVDAIKSVKTIDELKKIAAVNITQPSDKPKLKISDLTSEQFQSLKMAFDDLRTASSDKVTSEITSTDHVKPEEILQVFKETVFDQDKQTADGSSEKDIATVDAKLYKGPFILRAIHEDLPECYRLYDLAEEVDLLPELKLYEGRFVLSTLPEDEPESFETFDGATLGLVLIETEEAPQSGCVPECGQDRLQGIKLESAKYKRLPELIPENSTLLDQSKGTEIESFICELDEQVFESELETEPDFELVDEPIYHSAVLKYIELPTADPQLGIAFEAKEGVLIETDETKPPAPLQDPIKYYIAKNATLAEYDYIYEPIDQDKIIKKIEVQTARRRKIPAIKPETSQQMTQTEEKIIESKDLKGHVKEEKQIGEIHKTTATKRQEEVAEKSDVLPSQAMQHVESKYIYEKPIVAEPKYETVEKLKVAKELPEFSQKTDEKVFEISAISKLDVEKLEVNRPEVIKDANRVDSFYKYEKPIVEEPIYEKSLKTKIPEVTPEHLQKKFEEKEFEILTKTKLSDEKPDQFQTQFPKDVNLLDSYYRYEKPVVQKPIYEKSIKTKIPKDIPETLQMKTDEKEFVISTKSKETGRKPDVLVPLAFKHVDSFYKYEKPVVAEPIYAKTTKAKIPKEKPEHLQKKTDEKEFEISTKSKETGRKSDALVPQAFNLVDSFYKYEKPIVVEPIYAKTTKAKIPKEKPEHLQKKTDEKEFAIATKTKETGRKPDALVPLAFKHVDSFYKYEKPIVVEPIYEKTTKAKIPKEKPEHLQKKTDEKEFEISTKKKLGDEKPDQLQTQAPKDVSLVDSYYRYEKPVVQKPIYEKSIKTKIPKDIPETLQMKTDEKEFVISTKSKETGRKPDVLVPLAFKHVDSFYKYEKPVVAEPIYAKTTKAKIPKEKPEHLQKKTDEKEFEISTKSKETGRKSDALVPQAFNLVDSFYKYEKPIVVEPIYAKTTKAKIPKEKPEHLQKKTDEKEFAIATKTKETGRKPDALVPLAFKHVDSFYKYEKPIVVEPIYEKTTKAKIPKEKPEHLQKKTDEKEFEISTKSKETGRKSDALVPQAFNLVDSFYKYEKPIVVEPIYAKTTKAKIPKEKPELLQKKTDEKEFAIATKTKETGRKSDALVPQSFKLVDSFYKYEKPIVVEPIYEKTTKAKIPKEKPEHLQKKTDEKEFEISTKSKETGRKSDALVPQAFNLVDSFYKYEKPIVVEPIYAKTTKAKIPKDIPETLQMKTGEKEFGIALKSKERGETSDALRSEPLKDASMVDSFYKYVKPIVEKPINKISEAQKITQPYIQPGSSRKLKETKPMSRLDSYYKYQKFSDEEREAPILEKLIRTTLPTDQTEKSGRLIEDNYKRTYSDYKYDKPKVEQNRPIPVYNILDKFIAPSSRPEFATILKQFPLSLKFSDYFYQKPEAENITYDTAEKNLVPPEKLEQATKLKEHNFKWVYSDYKFVPTVASIKEVVIPVYHVTTTDVPIANPETGRRFDQKLVHWVDSYYKFVQPAEEEKDYQTQTANTTRLAQDIPEPFEPLKKKLFNYVDSYYNSLKQQQTSEKPTYEHAAAKKTTPEEAKSYQRPSSSKFDRVESEYYYERPIKEFVPLEYGTVKALQSPSEEPESAEKVKKKQFRTVDSYYEYEKPIKPKEFENLKVATAVILKKPGIKFEVTAKIKQSKYGLTDSDYEFGIFPKEELKIQEKSIALRPEEVPDQKAKIGKPAPQLVDSFYKYERPKKEIIKLKRPKTHYVDSVYRYEKDVKEVIEPVYEKVTAKKNQELPYRTTMVKIKSKPKRVDSVYKYEPPIRIQEPVVTDTVTVKKIQEEPDQKTKIKIKSEQLYVDSEYRYEKAIREPPAFQRGTVSKSQKEPDGRSKIHQQEAQHLDSIYRYEKPIHEKEVKPAPLLENATKIHAHPDTKTKVPMKDLAHRVDSHYKYEPPDKGPTILEPITIQTATKTHQLLDEPEYNVMINEHDAIWINFVYKYEKIRPDILTKMGYPHTETVHHSKLLDEKPERKQSKLNQHVYEIATTSQTPRGKRSKSKSMAIPEFHIIPSKFKMTQPTPGPSSGHPTIDSKKSLLGKRKRDEPNTSTWPATAKKKKPSITCPNCNNVVDLVTIAKNTKDTHLMAVMLAPLMMCFVPYVLNRTRDVSYRCSFCNANIMKPSKKNNN